MNLNNEIINTEEKRAVVEKKENKLRKILITNIIISAIGYYFGLLLHPLVPLISLFFALANILIGGAAVLIYEIKGEKHEKQLENYKKELELAEESLEQLCCQSLAAIPSPTQNKSKTEKIVSNTKREKNKIKKIGYSN